jgi:hypothetical protein
MEGYAFLWECPQCKDELQVGNVLISDHRTILVLCFCQKCQIPIYFDLDLIWLSREMVRLGRKQLPAPALSKELTLKDISELKRMGIADVVKDNRPQLEGKG